MSVIKNYYVTLPKKRPELMGGGGQVELVTHRKLLFYYSETPKWLMNVMLSNIICYWNFFSPTFHPELLQNNSYL